MEKKVYQKLASMVQARLNCIESKNEEWFEKWSEMINGLVENGPSGSGIDLGTKIDLKLSHGEKLVLYTSYHHMNEGGMYDGWTEHKITVTPSLAFGFNLNIGGRDRNMIKEYLHEVYSTWLEENVKV